MTFDDRKSNSRSPGTPCKVQIGTFRRGDTVSSADHPVLVNVERLNRYMDKAGCAAIVARSGRNFTYFSGVAYPGTLGRHLVQQAQHLLCLDPRLKVMFEVSGCVTAQAMLKSKNSFRKS